MMNAVVKNIVNAPVNSNCFIIYNKKNTKCIIVDPGAENQDELFSFLMHENLIPEYIIITHEHFDHIWGVKSLKEKYGCKLVCSEKCRDKIIDKKKNMSVFYDQKGFESPPADIVIEAFDNRLTWDNLEILFLHTPGHTDSSISFFFQGKLFVGDLMIEGSKTVTKLPSGNTFQLKESLMHIWSMFDTQPIEIYPGHGKRFLLQNVSINDFI